MAKVSLLFFGRKVPSLTRRLLSQWGIEPVVVRKGEYLDVIRRGEYDAYFLSRFWAEHDYGMPLPSPDGVTLRCQPKVATSNLPADRAYIVPRWPKDRSEEAYSSVWAEAAAALDEYRCVALPIGQLNCVAAPIGMSEFGDEDEASTTIRAFFSVIAPLARER